MRALKPRGQDAIFGQPIQDSVRADNRRVLRSRQDENSHHHYEAVEDQPRP